MKGGLEHVVDDCCSTHDSVAAGACDRVVRFGKIFLDLQPLLPKYLTLSGKGPNRDDHLIFVPE